MSEADNEPITSADARPKLGRSATLEDFDDALSHAQIIADIIGNLALAEIGGHAKIDASMFDWLADELGARLERIEVAGNTLMRRACV